MAKEELVLDDFTWSYNTRDEASFVSRKINDELWGNIPAKSKIFGASTKVLWLRTKIDSAFHSQKRLAIFLEHVCGIEHIYINGILINENKSISPSRLRCFRSVIHPIPDNLSNFLEEGGTTIAIRLLRPSRFSNPALQAKMSIMPLQKAENYLWYKNLNGIIYAALSLILAMFFLIIYLRLHRTPAYFSFSMLLFFYSAYKFFQNEIAYVFASTVLEASLYSRIELSVLTLLPYLFYVFFIQFFSLERIQFEIKVLKIKLDTEATRFGNTLFYTSILVALISIIHPNLTHRLYIPSIWLLLQVPFFIFCTYVAIQHLYYKKLKESISFLSGGFILLSSFIYDLPSFELFSAYSGGGMFALNLCLAIGLLYTLIMRAVKVAKHEIYIQSIDELQSRIFGYIGGMLAKPIKRVIINLEGLWETKSSKIERKEKIAFLSKSVADIQSNLDSLMELARLEILTKPEHLEQINLQDFLSMIVARMNIQIHLRINPQTTIETGLELMNSAMFYLLDFLENNNFRLVDLVVTSQSNDKILFHFLAFHPNPQKSYELYQLCTLRTLGKYPRSIKWVIITELMRILQGNLKVHRVRGRFLRINFSLPVTLRNREFSQNKERIKTIEDKKPRIELVMNSVKTSTKAVASTPAEERGEFDNEIKTLQFHANMNLKEVIQFVKSKFHKKRK